jgi:4-diphosphocytidyl-2-C-methyl-D-erythritol kinase
VGFLADPARFTEEKGRNDLQPAAESEAPDVKAVAKWLEARFGNSRMTGSGSAVFARIGIEDPPAVQQATWATWPADELPSGWVGRMCRSLERHPLLGWAD